MCPSLPSVIATCWRAELCWQGFHGAVARPANAQCVQSCSTTQRCACHWSQDDLFYESLTVWETLKYAAALRLPQHMSKEAKKQRVEMVITALGLTACKNTIIGVLPAVLY